MSTDGRTVGSADDVWQALLSLAPPPLDLVHAYAVAPSIASVGVKAVQAPSFPAKRPVAREPLVDLRRYGANCRPSIAGEQYRATGRQCTQSIASVGARCHCVLLMRAADARTGCALEMRAAVAPPTHSAARALTQ